jgi:hypothetical protein
MEVLRRALLVVDPGSSPGSVTSRFTG